MTKQKDNKKNDKSDTPAMPFYKRFSRFLMKTIIALLFLLYLIITGPSAWSWAKMHWYRQIHILNLPTAVAIEREQGDIKDALFFVQIRPRAETEQMLAIMLPEAPKLEPLFYFDFSRRYAELDNMEEAAFWLLLGRYRLRYDALRCENQDAPNWTNLFSDIAANTEVEAWLRRDEDRLKKVMQRVLDWDAAHPPQNKPDYFCRLAAHMDRGASRWSKHHSEWPDIHKHIRAMTELYLEGEEGNIDKYLEKLEGQNKTEGPDQTED